jgi:hypothetical protein
LDLVDLLPRFKGKYPPFATVISTDPIAKPSIDALSARGAMLGRVQNGEDEAKGILKKMPMPTSSSKSLSYLPQVAGRPWSLVT